MNVDANTEIKPLFRDVSNEDCARRFIRIHGRRMGTSTEMNALKCKYLNLIFFWNFLHFCTHCKRLIARTFQSRGCHLHLILIPSRIFFVFLKTIIPSTSLRNTLGIILPFNLIPRRNLRRLVKTVGNFLEL